MTNAPQPRPGWALYLRVSDEDKQSPERSFAMQRDEIRRVLLEDSDIGVVAEYRDMLTGTNYDRREFQQMMTDAEAGRFSSVAIYRVDRLGRDTSEGLAVANKLIEWGVRVVPASNPSLDISTVDGKLLFTVLLSLGEHEVGVLRMRTTGGMRAKAESGIWCWRAPDGYKNVKEDLGGKTQSWVEIDPERAPIIRQAWDMLLTGEYSFLEICEALQAEGHTRANGRPWVWYKKGERRYAHSLLSRIFHNPLYAGWIVSEGFDIRWGQVRSQAGALVTDAEWHLAQEILEDRTRHKLNTKHDYLLQALATHRRETDGEIIDMQCATTRRETRGDIAYYVIPRGTVSDQGIYLPTDQVDASLEDLLDAIAVDPDLLPALREHYERDVARAIEDDFDQRVTTLKRRLSELRETEKQYARLFALKKLTLPAYEDLVAEVHADLNRAQTTLARIQHGSEKRLRGLDRAADLITKIPEAWPHLKYKERRQLLRLLFREVRVDIEGNVLRSSVLRTPFAYLVESVTSVTKNGDAGEAPPGDRSNSCGFGTPTQSDSEYCEYILRATTIERPELLYRVNFP